MEKLRKEAVFFIMSLAVLFCSSCNSGFREEKRIEAEISTFVASRQNGSIPTIPATTIILTATETAIPAIPTVPRVTPWIATYVPEQPVVHFTDAIEKSAIVQNAPLQQSTSQEIDQKYTPIIVDANPSASDWRNCPVVPQLSKTAADIFWFGVNHMGTRANYFSKVGDCQSYSNVFLGNYDQIAGYYELSDDELYLEDAIHFFSKAFGAESLAVNNGMSVASVLTSTWADPSFCNPYESMIQCELRVNKPSIIFVNLGTNWNVDWKPVFTMITWMNWCIQSLKMGLCPFYPPKRMMWKEDTKLMKLLLKFQKNMVFLSLIFGLKRKNWRMAGLIHNAKISTCLWKHGKSAVIGL
jgi:hypothetical protein